MKHRLVLSALSVIITAVLFSGCEYNVPITDRRVIPVDEGLLGVWQAMPGKNKAMAGKKKMLILKTHNTEYLIQYPLKGDSMYFRGYPVKLGGHNAIQIQFLGTKNGAAANNKRKYHLVSYTKTARTLDVKILNTAVISKDIRKSEVMKKKVMQNKARRDLFINPAKFAKIK